MKNSPAGVTKVSCQHEMAVCQIKRPTSHENVVGVDIGPGERFLATFHRLGALVVLQPAVKHLVERGDIRMIALVDSSSQFLISPERHEDRGDESGGFLPGMVAGDSEGESRAARALVEGRGSGRRRILSRVAISYEPSNDPAGI